MGVRVDRRGVARISTGPLLAVRPAVIRAADAEIQLLPGGCVVVPAHLADKQLPGDAVEVRAKRVPQASRPDRVHVGAGTVVERVVGGDTSVSIDPMDLSSRRIEPLRALGHEMVARCEVQLPVTTERDRTPVMLLVGVQWILIQDDLAAGDRPRYRAVGSESRQAVAVRRSECVKDIEVAVG